MSKINITDVDKNLNNRDQFRIEVNEEWHTVDAKDFFDYLWETDRISGHDPEKGMAWVETIDYEFNPFTNEGRDVRKGSCNPYDWWIEHFIDNDEVLLQYVKDISLIVDRVAQAA